MTPLVYTMPRGTTQIDDISTWLPPSLHTPWQNGFFEYINNRMCYWMQAAAYVSSSSAVPGSTYVSSMLIFGCLLVAGLQSLLRLYFISFAFPVLFSLLSKMCRVSNSITLEGSLFHCFATCTVKKFCRRWNRGQNPSRVQKSCSLSLFPKRQMESQVCVSAHHFFSFSVEKGHILSNKQAYSGFITAWHFSTKKLCVNSV